MNVAGVAQLGQQVRHIIGVSGHGIA